MDASRVGVVDTAARSRPGRCASRSGRRRVNQLLGEDISVDEQRALLERVEIDTEAAGAADAMPVIAGDEPLDVAGRARPRHSWRCVPGHRRDLAIEADIIEEIARVRGYETLGGRLPDTPMPGLSPRPAAAARRAPLRCSPAPASSELITHGLIGPEDHARLGFGADDQATIRAANPVTIDHSELRRSMIPEHLRVLVENERQRTPDIHAFEIGRPAPSGRTASRSSGRRSGIILAGRERPVTHDRPRRG